MSRTLFDVTSAVLLEERIVIRGVGTQTTLIHCYGVTLLLHAMDVERFTNECILCVAYRSKVIRKSEE